MKNWQRLPSAAFLGLPAFASSSIAMDSYHGRLFGITVSGVAPSFPKSYYSASIEGGALSNTLHSWDTLILYVGSG